MDPEYSTHEAVKRIDDERGWWEGLLTSASYEQMEQSDFTGGWAFKDVVAHLSGWQRRALDRLAAACRGESEPLPPWPAELSAIDDEDERVEQINAWIYSANRNRNVDEVLAESRAQWDELRALVDTMPESVLNDPKRFPGLDGASLGQSIVSGDLFGHFHEKHEPTIRAWIDGL